MTAKDEHPELPLDPDVAPFTAAALLAVFAGGAVGSVARYALAVHGPHDGSWPLPTFLANLAGAFLLGAILETLARRGPDRGRLRQLRLLLGTGFCGGFTTYSTFAVESDLLTHHHDYGTAVGYAVASIVAGVILAAAGIAAATRLQPRR